MAQTVARGTGARRQREVFEGTGSLVELVDWLVSQTAPEDGQIPPEARAG